MYDLSYHKSYTPHGITESSPKIDRQTRHDKKI